MFCGAFSDTAWALQCDIVSSLHPPTRERRGWYKESLETTGGLHHRTTAVVSYQMLSKQGIADVEGLDKALETVAAAGHQFACQLEVLLQQGFFNRPLPGFQETAQ